MSGGKSRKRSDYTGVDNGRIATQHEIGTTAFCVYVGLARHANESGKCFPSAETLSKYIGCNKKTVLRGVQRLELHGWIQVDRALGAANRYTLLPIVTRDTSVPGSSGVNTPGTPMGPVPPESLPRDTRVPTTRDTSGTLSKPNEVNQVSKPNKAVSRKAKKTDGKVVIPAELDTERFRQWWGEWKAYRTEKRNTLTDRTSKMQLKKMAKFGEPSACEAIEKSITQGWTGIFPEENSNGTNGSMGRPVQQTRSVARVSDRYGPGSTGLDGIEERTRT